ncbi:Efflux transporter, RND family, MFP subunit [Candidatus Propionivibrio aalborgensis]|jgi:HlyD family secretion protein|uniref:Efflux transporter, RND family, MFP subunit n=1 Tax=Candidatus Propionivibrio aalborgensis TaxID=1860101 RepID=A0A1A8XH40_9RHOO|nr:efflux RND transporter periplasmic adaptor subunit [Candidatus Propionivibrio aalborgensis]MBK9027781.1 efflux RND transporter periplasmic adaptor subunit [Propionivibrio sp.]SBT04499.1 Efflux transporter, RND family, MFP subunit [Candidatus Propionivibrio aalborgensis]
MKAFFGLFSLPVFRQLVGRLGLIVLLLALLFGFGIVVLRSGPLAPIRVTTVQVAEGSVSPALFGIGTVEARRSYLVGPTAAGRVLKVLVDVGESVRAGQLLAEMDPVDLDERVAALDASIARAGSAIAAAEAQRRDAQARSQLAVMNTRRYVDLGEKNFVSASAVEGKQQEQVSAQAVSSGAQANLAAAGQDVRRLQAERDALRQQRDMVRLLAPSDGVITARDAEPGSTVVAGQAVVRLIDPASLWIRVRFDQGRSRGLAVGLSAGVVLRSNPAQSQPGKVARLELLSDSVTEERVAQVAFDSIPSGVSLGELAEVTLSLPATQDGLLLPNASIRQQGGQTGVWLYEDGTLRFVAVQVGLSSLDGKVQVLIGVKAGDRVVLHNEKELTAGSRIKVVDSLIGPRS